MTETCCPGALEQWGRQEGAQSRPFTDGGSEAGPWGIPDDFSLDNCSRSIHIQPWSWPDGAVWPLRSSQGQVRLALR